MRKRIGMIMVFIVLLIGVRSNYAQVSYTLDDIKKVEGKVQLELIQTWGNDEDDQMIFKIPTDLKVNSAGNFYVMDSGQTFIKAYNDNGQFLHQVGRRGEGPGEYIRLQGVFLDLADNVHVTEFGRKYEAVYDKQGKYLGRNLLKRSTKEIFFLKSGNRVSLESSYSGEMSFYIVKRDKNQKLLNKIMEVRFTREGGSTWDQLLCCVDNQEKIYGFLKATPIIRKFSSDGKMLIDISYATPFETYHKIIKGDNPSKLHLKLKKSIMIVHGVATDSSARLYVVVKNRKMSKEMKKIYSVLSGGSSGSRKAYKITQVYDANGLFRLLVFNQNGELIASKNLNIFCDSIAIYKNHLYALDTYYSTKIYKYKISFLKGQK
jgi:hypothetical protein